jgi:hypothetical protein
MVSPTPFEDFRAFNVELAADVTATLNQLLRLTHGTTPPGSRADREPRRSVPFRQSPKCSE